MAICFLTKAVGSRDTDVIVAFVIELLAVGGICADVGAVECPLIGSCACDICSKDDGIAFVDAGGRGYDFACDVAVYVYLDRIDGN